MSRAEDGEWSRLERAFGDVPEPARDLARSLDPRPAARFVADKAMLLTFPDRLDDQLFRDAIYRSSLDNIDTMWRIIAGRTTIETVAPMGAFEFAEAAGELGVPVSQFERVYRVGIGLVWICWYQEATGYAERTGSDLTALLGAPTMIIHAYIDALLLPMLERYDATRSQTRRTRDQLRRSILREALGGAPVLDEPEAVEALGVTTDGEYVAFAVREERLNHDLTEYARRAAGAAVALSYRHATDTWIVWLWRPDTFDSSAQRALGDALRRSEATIAVSDVLPGAEGLGATGRDALETAQMQRLIADGNTVVYYADVRLEALLYAEPERARRFVRAELRELGNEHPRTGDLRDTALVWLSTGSNVTTAARLDLHEHTVRNRIAQAEQLLGHPLAERRTELLVALRLMRMLSRPSGD